MTLRKSATILTVFMFLASVMGIAIIISNIANASDINPYGAPPMLWQTEEFYGKDPNNKIVFYGTAYYYFLQYGISEDNSNYNWYIIAVQINNANNADSNEIGGICTDIQLYANGPTYSVWNVNWNPVNHSPWDGAVTVSVGTNSAGISFNLDPDGYDNGTENGGNSAYYGEYTWYHYFTIADQDTWSYLVGAYCGQTGALSSGENAVGEVAVSFYMWWTGGWNPFAGTSGWISATYESGCSGSVQYPYYT